MSKIARIPVSSLPPGPVGFVKWLKVAQPPIYRAVAARFAARGVSGLGLDAPTADPVVAAAAKPGIGQQILDTVKDLVQVGLPLYQQNKLFDLQLKRAQAGLAPLDTAALADASALRVGVDSGTRNTGLIIAGVAAAALLGFALLKR
jgi:hypothetical protein